MTKALVIYHTQFGNTETIAKALASGLSEQGIEVDQQYWRQVLEL